MATRSCWQVSHLENLDIPAIVDRRIAEMRRMLADIEPDCAASALRALRDAFPEATLEERVRALTAVRH